MISRKIDCRGKQQAEPLPRIESLTARLSLGGLNPNLKTVTTEKLGGTDTGPQRSFLLRKCCVACSLCLVAVAYLAKSSNKRLNPPADVC